MPSYIAMIGTHDATVIGSQCDVSVSAEYEATADRGPSVETVLPAIQLDTRVDDPNQHSQAVEQAERILAEHCWAVTGPWEIHDHYMSAPAAWIGE